MSRKPPQRAYLLVDNQKYAFDACIEETYSDDSEITDHPIEDGSDVTDHIRPKPEEITLDVQVSNSTITNDQSPELSGFIVDTKNGLSSAFVENAAEGDSIFVGPARAEAFYLAIKQFKRLGKTVQVFTTLVTDVLSLITVDRGTFSFLFSKFVIKSTSVIRNKDKGNIVRMTLNLKAVKFVTNKSIEAPSSLVTSGADLGSKNALPAAENLVQQVRTAGGGILFEATGGDENPAQALGTDDLPQVTP